MMGTQTAIDDARNEFMSIVYDELFSDGDNNRANRIIDAADEYVEAVQTKPCEDAISRKMVLDFKCDCYDSAGHLLYAVPTGYILRMPPVIPMEQWIPVSETIDIPDHEILACDRYGNELIGWLDCKDEQWLCESDGEMMYDVIAWMEKPKSYTQQE